MRGNVVGWGEKEKWPLEMGKSGANPGPTTQHLVGQGPCALPGVRYGIGGRTGASGPTDDKEICASPVRADVGIGPYENATRGAMGGRPQGSPLRKSYKGCGKTGRCGERTERCRWQKQRSERVAAVKILSVRRKAAQKFWAPQQDHRPLRRGCKIERRAEGSPPYGGVTRSACMRADRGVRAYGGLRGVQWAGDRKGRPYEVLRGMCGRGIGPCGSFLTGREWYVSDFGGGG